MTILRPFWRPLLGAALGFGLGGCAVMQIDVDVYKGPLANHKDIHTEQVAVMAVGAEPLVKRLRADLNFLCEKSKAEALKAKGRAVEEVALKQVSGKKADTCFQKDVVDGILNLFQDREDLGPAGKLLSLVERVEAASRQLQEADMILNPRNLSGSLQELFGALEKPEIKASAPVLRRQLANGYRSFLQVDGSGRRNWNFVFEALRAAPLEERQRAVGPYAFRADRLPNDSEESGKKTVPDLSSSNLAYEILGDDAFLQAQAAVLFPDDAALRTLFVREVGQVGRSFGTAREAVEDILLGTLEGLTLYGRVEFKSEAVENKLLEAVSNFVADDLIQPHHLRIVLQKGDYGVAQKYLVAGLDEELRQENSVENLTPDDKGREAIKQALSTMLRTDPVVTSQMLLALNPKLKSGLEPTDWSQADKESNQAEKYEQTERWRFGLAAGPDDEIFNKVPVATKEIAREVRRGVRFFEEGRFTAGIFTLVQEYLAQLQQDTLEPCGVGPLCENGPTELETKRELLLTALVHFAEKILFVVNNEVLFDESTLLTPIKDSVPGTKLKDQDYILVLQTVGNSMLVHVDAIRQETAHERQLVRDKDREAEGIAQVFGGGATLAFAQLVQSLKEGITAAQAEAKRQAAERTKANSELEKATKAFETAQRAERAARSSVGQPPEPTPQMAQLQAAWLSLGQDPKVFNTSNAAADPADLAVKAKIDTLVEDSNVTPAQFYDKLSALLTSELLAEADKALPVPGRFARLNLAVQQFSVREFKATFTPPAADNKTQREKIESTLKTEFANKKVAFLQQHAAYFANSSALNAAQASKKAAQSEMERAKTAAETAKAKEDAATARAEALEKAAPVIAAAQAPVIAAAEKSTARPLGRAVHVELAAYLRGEAGKPENAARKQDLEAAAVVANSLPIPLVAPSGYSVDARNAKEVLDGLIAGLRQLHTRTQLENIGDQNNQAIARAAAALAEAYRQRADMIYIRPAVAYLRTSFTATTLQDNNLAWRNLLSHHGYRSTVPIIPAWEAKQEAKVATEIDKQFWHNVNRVRVAGAGDTNYAIAKDDLGNWYVKSYSADPEDIIKSAKNLALFAAGPSLGVPIPLDAGSVAKPAANTDGPTPAAGLVDPDAEADAKKSDPSKSVFVRQFEQFREKFRIESKKDIAAAQEAAKSFKDRIKKDWEHRGLDASTIDSLDGILDSDEKDPINTKLLKLGDVETKDAPRKLALGLRAIRDYHLRVTQAIKNKGDLDDSKKKTAVGSVTDVVLRSELKQLVERTRRNMERYAVELEIIGQTGTDLDINGIEDG